MSARVSFLSFLSSLSFAAFAVAVGGCFGAGGQGPEDVPLGPGDGGTDAGSPDTGRPHEGDDARIDDAPPASDVGLDAAHDTGTSSTDGGPPDVPPTTGHSTRVITYVPNWNGSFASWAAKIEFTRFTHINLAFANADDGSNELGLGDSDDSVKKFIAAAHASKVKVMASLGGGADSDKLTRHYAPGNVDAFVAKVGSFLDRLGLDGVDVDVESPGKMGKNVDTFVAKLHDLVKPKGQLLTAAVARWIQDGGSGMSAPTYALFDFVNVMSYGTYDDALADMKYFTETARVPKAQVVLGVKFYADCSGACDKPEEAGHYMLYRDVLKYYPDAWNKDLVDADGSKLFYVGEATMKRLADLSKDYGGVMSWELTGDASGAHSLMGVIAKEIP